MSNDSINDFIHSNNPCDIHQSYPRIFVACLSAYNDRKIHGIWINMTQDFDKTSCEIYKMLSTSPVKDAEDYTILVAEGFGCLTIGCQENIFTVFEKAIFVWCHGALGARLIRLCNGNVEDAKDLMAHYERGYESEVDFEAWLFKEFLLSSTPETKITYSEFKQNSLINVYLSLNVEGRHHVFTRQ